MVAWRCAGNRLHAALLGLGVACLVGCAKKSNRDEVFGLASSSAMAATRARAPKPAELNDTCTRICDRSQVLKCKNADQCLVNCIGAASGTPCNAEFLAFYGCLVPQPIANWECDEDGVAAIKPGLCDREQQRAIDCMKAKAQP